MANPPQKEVTKQHTCNDFIKAFKCSPDRQGGIGWGKVSSWGIIEYRNGHRLLKQTLLTKSVCNSRNQRHSYWEIMNVEISNVYSKNLLWEMQPAFWVSGESAQFLEQGQATKTVLVCLQTVLICFLILIYH